METFDAANEGTNAAAAGAGEGPAATEKFSSRATVGADGFVSRAVADPAVVRFLGMRPNTVAVAAIAAGSGSAPGSANCNLTLRDAFRELDGMSGGGVTKGARSSARTSRLCWGDIDALLFEPYDPTAALGNPPSSVPIGATSAVSGGKQKQHHEEEEEEEEEV